MSAEFADRPEVTVSTMGKVHNPSGKNVPIKKAASSTKSRTPVASSTSAVDKHETVTSSKNTAKRNIVRKNNTVNTKENYNNRGKKMGGAGKGQWGNNLVDDWNDYDAAGEAVFDKDDPLYDETEDKYVLVSDATAVMGDGTAKFDNTKVYGSVYTQTEFKRRVTDVCIELYSTNLIPDTILQLKDLLDSCPNFGHFLVKKCIEKSLDFGSRECELTSQLLVHLVHADKNDGVDEALLSMDEMEQGFELLLNSLGEMAIDCPGAGNALTSYLARAVVDEVVSPAFLVRIEDDLELASNDEENNALEVVLATKRLLSREHGSIRLEHVWGPGDGTRSVTELKQLINQILKEYLLCSLDITEAVRSIRELNVCPFFAHELVKQAIVMSIEENDSKESQSSSIRSMDAMVLLLAVLKESASHESTNSTTLLTSQQLKLGLSKFENRYLNDLELDVPGAKDLFNEFCSLLSKNNAFKNDL